MNQSSSSWPNELHKQLLAFAAYLNELPEPYRDRLAPEFQAVLDRFGLLSPPNNHSKAIKIADASSPFEILHYIAEAICIIDLNQCILFWNRAAQKLYGWSADEALGRPFSEIIHPDAAFGTIEDLLQQAPEGEKQTFETIHYSRTGKKLSIELSLTPVGNLPEKISGYLVVSRDVTDRVQVEVELRQSEAALRASEQRLLTLVENLPIGILFTDQTGQFNIVNPANKRLFGGGGVTGNASGPSGQYSLRHADGSPFPQDELPLVRALSHGEMTRDVEILIRHDTGEEVVILANTSPVYAPDGAISGAVAAMQDITERKRMENELRRQEAEFRSSEERFRLASKAVPGMIYDWNLITNQVYRSEGIETLLGLSKEEAQTPIDWWLERIHPEDAALIQDCIQQIRAGSMDIFNYEYRMRHNDGHWIYILDRSYIVRDARQKAIRMVGSVTDITARKQYEKTLQESESRERERAAELQAIMDAAPIYMWVARDSASRRIDGNRAAYEVLRMKPGENISKTAPLEEIPHHFRAAHQGSEIPPEELPVQIAASQGVHVHDYEMDIEFDDGQMIHMVGNATPLFDQEGKPRGAVSAFIDITARKQAEQALYESELRFRIALANAPIMVYTMDRNLRYTWVYNPSDCQPASEIIGKRQEEIEPAPETAETLALKRMVIATGEGIQQEIKSQVGGETHYYILNLEPIQSSSGMVIGLTGAVLDVTRQRGLEAERQEYLTHLEVQRRLMEYREKERQEIARDIHDGPIQTLVSTLFNLQVSKEALPDPMLKNELEQIGQSLKGAVRELRVIVNELRPPSLLRFGLARAIRIHVEDLRERHPELLVEAELFDDNGQMPEPLCLTLFRIYQESMNNIIHHAQATHIWLRLVRQENNLVFEVQDNGKGFTQTEDLAKQTQKGHFGLAGMSERAQTAGGKLTIITQPELGTTIRVTVPWWA